MLPKCSSLNLKGNNPYSLMLPFGLFMQHRLGPIQCSLHLLYVVQDSGGSKWSLSRWVWSRQDTNLVVGNMV